MTDSLRHADPVTIDHIIRLRKERDEALADFAFMADTADLWREKAIEWMERCFELQQEIRNVRAQIS